MLEPSSAVMDVWRTFDGFPMETLTKAWLHRRCGGPRQRTVREMAEHRRAFGTSGNCFDLAIWLLHDLQEAGVRAHAIGHDLFTPQAHVAVLAYDRGQRYLCDLGDQWIRPVPINVPAGDVAEPLPGYFPGARIRVAATADACVVTYHRAAGKWSTQSYALAEVGRDELLRAGQHAQSLLRRPLCEIRVPLAGEVAHWEFDNWSSRLSTEAALYAEPPAGSLEAWCARIHRRTGMSPAVVEAALAVYRAVRQEG